MRRLLPSAGKVYIRVEISTKVYLQWKTVFEISREMSIDESLFEPSDIDTFEKRVTQYYLEHTGLKSLGTLEIEGETIDVQA